MGRKQIATEDLVEAAVRELIAAGKEPGVNEVRRIVGGGTYTRLGPMINAAEVKIRSEQASAMTLKPELQEVGLRLFREAVAFIVSGVETDSKREIAELSARATEEIAAAKSAVSNAHEEIDSREEEIERLKEVADINQQRLQMANERAAELQGRLDQQSMQFEAERERLTAAAVQAREELRLAENDAAELRGQIAELSLKAAGEVAAAKGAVSKAQEEIDSRDEEIERLKGAADINHQELRIASERTGTLQGRLDQQSMQFDAERNRLSAVAEKAMAELSVAENEAAELRGQVASLREQNSRLTANLAKSEGRKY